METQNTFTSFSTFPVHKLEHFKNAELESGQFLVRKIEKGTGKDSTGVVIAAYNEESAVNALANPKILAAYLDWFNSQAGEVCKKLIAEGKTSLIKADYSIEAIAANLESEEISQGKVSKEKLEQWFKSEVSTVLARAFREKLGDSVSNDVIVNSLAMYQKVFVQFAKRENSWNTEICTKIEKALSLLPDSAMKSYCTNKLPSFAEKSADMLGL